MTQKDAAAHIGISGAYLTQLERGQRKPPSRDVLAKMAHVYQVPEQKLLEAAGYIPAAETQIDPEQIEWAFNAVLADPQYGFSTRFEGSDLTRKAKASIVKLYQEATGRRLLTDIYLEDD